MDQADDGFDAVAREAARLMAALGAGAPHDASGHETGDESDPQPDARDEQVCVCPSLCRRCPVCRIGGFIAQLTPETLERVADLLAMAAGSLHSAAEQRRAAGAPASAARPDPARAPESDPDARGWDSVAVDDGPDVLDDGPDVDGNEDQ